MSQRKLALALAVAAALSRRSARFDKTTRPALHAWAFVLCGLVSLSINALGQSAHTPEAGSAERTAIMDALRVPAMKDLGRPVIFKVLKLRVVGDWAYAHVEPTMPDGSEIDYSKTRFKEQKDVGMFDPQGEALLRRKGDQWKVLEWVFGATDVASASWSGKHDFPASLLE